MKSIYENPSVGDIIYLSLKSPSFIERLNIYLISRKLEMNDLDLKHTILLEKEVPGYEWDTKKEVPGEYLIDWGVEKYYFNLNPGTDYPDVYTQKYNTIGKYEVLFERFLPRLYRYYLSDKDISPEVTKSLNESVINGLANIEEMLYGLFDIYSYKTNNQFILQLMARLSGSKIHGNNPYLWKRQAKEAVTIHKKKGTREGLELALGASGIKLIKLTKLWQIVSKSIWTDAYVIRYDGEDRFFLTKPFLKIKEVSLNNIVIPESDYTITDGIKPYLSWKGKVQLFEEEVLRIKYQYDVIEDEGIEDYIDNLDLADERNQNVRLIEEDDPLFSTIVKDRHPFYDPLVYGKIRTTFLFSENIYNMDTYNGSLRDSHSPCDIDENFRDECSFGQSSKFNLTVKIEDLSKDRIQEVRDIVESVVPFHALLHELHIYAEQKDYLIDISDEIRTRIVFEDQTTLSDEIIYGIEDER